MAIAKRFRITAVLLFSIIFSQSLLAGSLFDVKISPEMPVLGDDVVMIVSLKSDYSAPDAVRPIFTAKLNGVDAVVLNPVEGSWVIELGTKMSLGQQELATVLYFEKKFEADKFRSSIQTISNTIDSLTDQINHENDPVIKSQLIAERDAKIAERIALEGSLAGVKEKIVDEKFLVEIESNLRLDRMRRNILYAQGHSLAVQHTDFGWSWWAMPQDLKNRDAPSPVNQFGLHVLALIEAYKITGEATSLRAIENSADVIMARTTHRCQRIFPNDSEMLGKASLLLGYQTYHQKMLDSLKAEKDCLAAYEVLDNATTVTNAQVDAVDQALLDAVMDVQRASRFRERLVWAGRNAGLRAFDWGARIRAYLYAGDVSMAKAIADVVAQDANEIVIANYYYLLGLSNTVSALKNWPEFQTVIDSAKAKLIAQQQEDGLFQVIKNEVVEEGTVQDQAFSLDALRKAGSHAELKKLTDIMIASQTGSGAYFFFGYESVEGQSELLEVLSKIYRGQTEKSFEEVVVPLIKNRRYTKNVKRASPFI